MHDFLTTLYAQKDASPRARREALLPLAKPAELARATQALSYSASPEEQRALTRALSDLCVDAACRRHIAHQFALRPALAGQLLANPDAKVRKNTAELLGRMDADAYADALIAAYRAEEIDFVKPSLLLALGSAHKNEAARAFLASLPPLEAGEAKHQRAQRDALSKAQDSLSPRAFVPVPDAPMQKPRDLLLTCPNARLAAEELSSLGWDARAFDAKSGLALVKNARAFLPVYRARAFYEAGILLFESDSLFHAVHGLTQPLVCRNVKNLYGRLDLSYRLDVVGPTITRDERLRAYRDVQDALATSPLHNSPSSYDFTLSILCLGRRFAAVLFPGSQNDTRFAYRKQAVSASIHPAVAAACCRVLAPYAQENSRVLDCFCGAGTFLLERARLPHASLAGSDISPAAVRIAQANAEAAGVSADLFVKDASHPFRHTYTEVIGNLPFGLRVSNHAGNERLYAAFLQNLRHMLAPGGRAFLFTNEKKLLLSEIDGKFALEGRVNFSAGGLYPALFLLRPLADA